MSEQKEIYLSDEVLQELENCACNAHINFFENATIHYHCCCNCNGEHACNKPCPPTNPNPEDFKNLIGICLEQTSGNMWTRCDGLGQPVTPAAGYYETHPVYAGMKPVIIDNQHMIEIPAFWIKHLTPETGRLAGKACKIISPKAAEGFRIYPAFIAPNGTELEKIYVGAYAATTENSSPKKFESMPGKIPTNNLILSTAIELSENRNEESISGFHLWNFHEYSAICMLFLIEHAVVDSQTIMGKGNMNSGSAVTTNASTQSKWRGFFGLSGNMWEIVDGIRVTEDKEITLFSNTGLRTWVNTKKIMPTFQTTVTYTATPHTGSDTGYCMEDYFLAETITTKTTECIFMESTRGAKNNSVNSLLIGGGSMYNAKSGLFTQLYTPINEPGQTVGARLAKY